MVLKKPYAFLIKHFRLIHWILLIPMFYLIIKTKAIVGFFSDYIAYQYSLNFISAFVSLAGQYINILMYVAVVFILIVMIFITLLLQNKKKPARFYSIAILYYIGLFVMISACLGFFNSIQDGTMSSVAARIIRDLSYMVHYSQYVFIAFMITRGLGFNVKKFDFKSDLIDLEIDSEDDEEFEFLVGLDTYKTKRSIRRFFRELRYYYLENKFICTAIIIVVVGILLTLFYTNNQVYDKVYKENERFSFGAVNVIVKDSFISNLTLNGKEINPKKTYLILQISVFNNFRDDQDFNYANFQAHIGKQHISPNISLGNYFMDYGNPYNGSPIKGNTDVDKREHSFILVYELDKSIAAKKINMLAFSRYDTSPGGLGAVLKTVELKPTTVNSKVITNHINKGMNINLKGTPLKDTSATIIDYEISNRHEYRAQYCSTTNVCREVSTDITITGSDLGRYTLLVLDYDLSLDEASSYMYSDKNFITFFTDFLQIKYKVNGNENIVSANVLNPVNYKDKLVLKVPTNIQIASEIEAIITVRNVSYSIKLK